MSSIRSTTGLASGLDLEAITQSLVLRQRAAVARFEARSETFSQRQAAIGLLETNVLTLQGAADGLSNADNFARRSITNSGEESVRVRSGDDSPLGAIAVRAVQLATAEEQLSRGFASGDAKTGAGQVVIRRGGQIAEATRLELLNDGDGVGSGRVRLTDRTGATATLDLSTVVTLDDVIEQVAASGLALELTAHDDRLRLTDTSGGGGSILVEDVEGSAAADLGLLGSSAAATLDGTSIYAVSESFQLAFLNDGNEANLTAGGSGSPDLQATAADGTAIDVVLDDAETLADVIDAINAADGNGGKVTASLSSGRLVLTDSTGGAGTLSVADAGEARVAETLGLTTTAVGNVLTGGRLSSGLNSVLLRTLNGGAGITTPGQVDITNAAGETATIDLSNAETLTDVLDAINGAVTGALNPLGVTARIDENGTGLVLVDTTGGAGTLSVADVGGGSTAADLGLTAAAIGGEIRSGNRNRRTVSEATSLADLTPGGSAPAAGQFQLTDSSGATTAIRITSAVKTVGDLMSRINANTDVQVRAALNDTGDGFVLIDEAGGGGSLTVAELDATTAADLRLLGDSVVGGDGKHRISNRDAVVISLDADSTYDDIVAAVNEQASFAEAALLDDGSRLNPTRLQLRGTVTGLEGRLTIETTGIDLGLTQLSRANDAIAAIGSNPATAFRVTSESNRFDDLAGGYDIELLAESDDVARINVECNTSVIEQQIQAFVEGYNALQTSIRTATSFDAEANTRGVLQGDGFVLRVEQRVTALLLNRSGPDAELRSLSALGVDVGEDGQLSFDTSQFSDRITADPDLVERFFTDESAGFGTKLAELVERLTDPIEGAFRNESDGLQASIDEIDLRIGEMNELLQLRQERLFNEFVRMEQIVSSLQAEQQAVAALQGIRTSSPNSSGS